MWPNPCAAGRSPFSRLLRDADDLEQELLTRHELAELVGVLRKVDGLLRPAAGRYPYLFALYGELLQTPLYVWWEVAGKGGTHPKADLCPLDPTLLDDLLDAAVRVLPGTASLDLTEGEESILRALRNADRPLRGKEIARMVGLEDDTVRAYLGPRDQLRRFGLICKVSQGYIAPP
jgi:hypothetical protein